MQTITIETLQQKLATRINEAEAELSALKGVTIDTKHKTLTNRAISGEGATLRTQSYSLNGSKELFVSYKVMHRYDGVPISASVQLDTSHGMIFDQRTMTPEELRKSLDQIIAGREESLKALKLDLVNSKKIVAKFNKLATQMNELTEGVTWATRSVLK